MRLLAIVAALLPQQGVLVPGKSLAGVRLGATPAQVTKAWGRVHGTCRGCAHTTWYFTYAQFDRHGVGVEFRRGRAVALFTLWQPTGWRTSNGLTLGAAAGEVTRLYGALGRTRCKSYTAFTQSRRADVTAFYVSAETLWGFALMRPQVPVCR